MVNSVAVTVTTLRGCSCGRMVGCARVIDGKRRGSSSVEEEISQVLVPKFRVRVLASTASCSGHPAVLACVVDCGLVLLQASSSKFHSAGREDIDVRMLGEGRPFVLQLIGRLALQRVQTCTGRITHAP